MKKLPREFLNVTINDNLNVTVNIRITKKR